jgi:hypothetical protein
MDPNLSDLRKVTLYFDNGSNASHIVIAGHLDEFIEATKRLHVSPGINPHNNQKTSEVIYITVDSLEMTGPFWWTTPTLNSNGDPAGAMVVGTKGSVVAYRKPY